MSINSFFASFAQAFAQEEARRADLVTWHQWHRLPECPALA
ncbi:hypothetical protein ACIO1C_17125 [Streptomyces sp. NPDC087420]